MTEEQRRKQLAAWRSLDEADKALYDVLQNIEGEEDMITNIEWIKKTIRSMEDKIIDDDEKGFKLNCIEDRIDGLRQLKKSIEFHYELLGAEEFLIQVIDAEIIRLVKLYTEK